MRSHGADTMTVNILMPALSPTMEQGKIAKWLKAEGDRIKSGDVVAEIETDKATMEFEAADDGILGRILVPEGAQGVKVNAPIALLLQEGENAAALDKARPAAKAPTPPTAAAPVPAGAPAPKPAAATSPPAAEKHADDLVNGHAGGARIFISPLARRLADEAKLDLTRISGSGPHGRIVKVDVEAAIKTGGAARQPAPAAGATRPAAAAGIAVPAYSREQVIALAGNLPFVEVPITNMRRVVARRLTNPSRPSRISI